MRRGLALAIVAVSMAAAVVTAAVVHAVPAQEVVGDDAFRASVDTACAETAVGFPSLSTARKDEELPDALREAVRLDQVRLERLQSLQPLATEAHYENLVAAQRAIVTAAEAAAAPGQLRRLLKDQEQRRAEFRILAVRYGLEDCGDLLPANLIEIRPTNKTLEAAQQVFDFCAGWSQLEGIDPEQPHDLKGQRDYSLRYHRLLAGINLREKVLDMASSPGQRRRIVLPSEVQRAVATERAAIFAYASRLAYVEGLRAQVTMTREQQRHAIDRAWVDLAGAPYSEADVLLSDWHEVHCQS